MLSTKMSSAAIGRIKAALIVVLLLPLLPVVGGALQATDPGEHLIGESGEFALRILLLVLLVTPLRLVTGWNWLLQTRRVIGLCAFFYAAIHFCAYLALDREFNFAAVLDDAVERKFILVGFAAFVLLVPLAATSNNWSVKKFGGKAWLKLHKLVYAAVLFAAAHYLWLNDDWAEPLVYLGVFAVLLVLRIPKIRAAVFRGKSAPPRFAAASSALSDKRSGD